MPHTATHDGTNLFYTDWGQGRPVVFAHAFGLNGDMWNYQVPALADAGYRCVTYDRRGHARSDRARTGYDIDTLADDLASVIDHLELSEAVVVGHSMGACEVVRYLSRHGTSRVAGVVLSAPTTPRVLKTEDNPDGVDASFFEAAFDLLRRDVGMWLGGATAGNFSYWGDEATAMSPQLGEWTMRQFMDTPVHILLETNKAFAFGDFRADLANLELPTLVISGDRDSSTPLELTGRKTAEMVRGSRLAVIEGAGHGVYASAADPYNTALTEFLESLD